METSKLKQFAQFARKSLIEQVSSKLTQVLKEESAERRELPQVVATLEEKLENQGKVQLIEQVAYIWFNRFCALRFMDVNGYNRIGVLSPAEGQSQPEILAEAKAGHIDEGVVNEAAREQIFGLLNGAIKSRDGHSEAYRLLIVAVCNDYHRIMPYLFERIEDYTELLMPDDLLSDNSILAYTREAMTPEACESVECIGWLYQFYISEKKDQVFEGLKKNKKITPENIPAATQLFTPHWIVRYLVENSLGRLWMLNNPSSKVIEQMDYYIKPAPAANGEEQQESDYLKITSPEEIKVCDPACGSGHMLTYAYDLLYAIYLDAGYDPVDIPELILTKNLYGIEIDERAAELAGFALSMKALKGNPIDESNNRRRFFRNPIKPNICRLETIIFDDGELDEYIEFVGRDLFTQDLRAILKDFEEADNFGSLIQPTLKNAEDVKAALEEKDVSGQLFFTEIHKRVLRAVDQADYLSQKYHVVVANPPYMGGRGMNQRLAKWVKDNYPDSKSDLFAMFMERNLRFLVNFGFSAMINMQSWMFLSTYEKLRTKLLGNSTFLTMAHLGERAFDTIGGAVVSTTAFVMQNKQNEKAAGVFIRLVNGQNEADKDESLLKAADGSDKENVYTSSTQDFSNIPGLLIAYWLSENFSKNFNSLPRLGKILTSREGLTTGSNDRFLRQWYEVSEERCQLPDRNASTKKWHAYLKGGDFRRWAGNTEFVVDWENDGQDILSFSDENTGRIRSHNYNGKWANQPGVTWSSISGADFSVRDVPGQFMFDTTGSMGFVAPSELRTGVLALLNSKVSGKYMRVLSPAIRFQPGHALNIPCSEPALRVAGSIAKKCVEISKSDWDAYEISWDFTRHPLLFGDYKSETLEASYRQLRTFWHAMVVNMQQLESENNQLFINAYGLEDEISPDVPLGEISLTCNPAYRYGEKCLEDDREKYLLADTMAEFISYAVGSILGRYSLDRDGLILASQSDTLKNYLEKIPEPSFVPDDDNVIPMIDFEGDWFEDDISERFKEFLKGTFGEEHFAENLAFIEEAIGKDIKKYFVKDFYADHVKRYKKRPIYWLFSSPKGTFNALIYMHRYRPDTVSVVLNDYLREFRTKLQARKESYEQVEVSASASQKEKTQAIKAIDKINKVLDEVNDYERDILYPLASQNIEIDLDDGVKANYPKFGKALKKITGLS